MAVRQILKIGNPQLLQKAAPVTAFNNQELDDIISDMFDTMSAQDGAGLAAPQIGISLRIVIFGLEENPRYPDAETVPTTILINPQIMALSDSIDEDWEGCLSVPNMRGLVPRYSHIRYAGFDPQGVSLDRSVQGFHARVVQHEVDHLEGILYPQRIRDMRMFGYESELPQEEEE